MLRITKILRASQINLLKFHLCLCILEKCCFKSTEVIPTCIYGGRYLCLKSVYNRHRNKKKYSSFKTSTQDGSFFGKSSLYHFYEY